jgi:hypothetical protein
MLYSPITNQRAYELLKQKTKKKSYIHVRVITTTQLSSCVSIPAVKPCQGN